MTQEVKRNPGSFRSDVQKIARKGFTFGYFLQSISKRKNIYLKLCAYTYRGVHTVSVSFGSVTLPCSIFLYSKNLFPSYTKADVALNPHINTGLPLMLMLFHLT